LDGLQPSKAREAVYWYKRSVKGGYFIAARNLAVHYKNLKVQRWYLHWLTVAANMGDAESAAELKKTKSRIHKLQQELGSE
jgi:TPR repeat protein